MAHLHKQGFGLVREPEDAETMKKSEPAEQGERQANQPGPST